jgi:hypothetical protein
MNFEQRRKFAGQNAELKQKMAHSVKYDNEQKNKPPVEEPETPPTVEEPPSSSGEEAQPRYQKQF